MGFMRARVQDKILKPLAGGFVPGGASLVKIFVTHLRAMRAEFRLFYPARRLMVMVLL